MELFKERLLETGKNVLVILLALIIVPIVILSVGYIVIKFTVIWNILTFLFHLFVALVAIGSVIMFVNWLIIEPYKTTKKNKFDEE